VLESTSTNQKKKKTSVKRSVGKPEGVRRRPQETEKKKEGVRNGKWQENFFRRGPLPR